jgi:hypothetical protein
MKLLHISLFGPPILGNKVLQNETNLSHSGLNSYHENIEGPADRIEFYYISLYTKKSS